MNDNERTCASCAHQHGEGGQRECRRYPPTMILAGMQQTVGGPRPALMPVIAVVAPDFRCGEWKGGGASVSPLRLA